MWISTTGVPLVTTWDLPFGRWQCKGPIYQNANLASGNIFAITVFSLFHLLVLTPKILLGISRSFGWWAAATRLWWTEGSWGSVVSRSFLVDRWSPSVDRCSLPWTGATPALHPRHSPSPSWEARVSYPGYGRFSLFRFLSFFYNMHPPLCGGHWIQRSGRNALSLKF